MKKEREEKERKKIEEEKIKQKEEQEKRQREHDLWISKGFKYYEWKSEYTIIYTERNIYKMDYGQKWTDKKQNKGRGYFRNEEELKKWLSAERETLLFCREL